MTWLARVLSSAIVPLVFVAIVVLWEAATILAGIEAYLVPPPSMVAAALIDSFGSGVIGRNLAVTLFETLAGFAIAVAVGTGLGALISEFHWMRRAIYPYVVALQTVPKIAIAPLFVLWFGFGLTSKVVIAALIGLFPILVNTIQGLAGTEPARIDMLRSVGANGWQIFRMVKVPSALPFIFAGFNTSIVLCLLGAIVGEFVGAREGLGALILTENGRMETASVFAILVVLSAVGITLSAILHAVQRRAVFWAVPKHARARRRTWRRLAPASIKPAIMLVVLAASLAGPAAAQAPRKLVVALGHQAITPFEELYMWAVPRELGYFAAEGLDVQVEPTAGGTTAVQLVAAGKADIGQAGPPALLAAVAKGVKIKAFYNITPKYGSGLAVLAGGGIKAPADLKGRALGVSSLSSSRVPEARTMIAVAGLKPEQVDVVAVGTGAQAAAALKSGPVSGLFLWDNAYFTLEAQGVALDIIRDVFPGSERLLDFLAFARADFIAENRAVLEAYGRAAAKGMLWTITNPEAALELHYKAFPNARPKNDAQRAVDLFSIRSAAKIIDFRTHLNGRWGHFPAEYVTATIEFLAVNGVIPTPVAPGDAVAADLVEAFNRFDADAVVKSAQAAK